MEIKLIALDMDGTLLNNALEISNKNKQILQLLMNEGISIALISGRNKEGLIKYANELELINGNHFLSCLNGTIIYSFKDDAIQRSKELTKKDADYLLKYTKKHHYGGLVYKETGFNHYLSIPQYIINIIKFFIKKATNTYFEGNLVNKSYFKLRFKYNENTRISKFVLLTKKNISKEEVDKIKKDLIHYEVCLVARGWIEITCKGVNKGNSINKIIESLKIRNEQVLAFGDSENDISMFNEIKYCIAMGNAMESIQEIAFDITDTNHNDGVSKYLNQYVVKEIENQKDLLLNNQVEVIIDRQIGYIDKYGTVYPINYGYIEKYLANDGEYQDAYIIDDDISSPIKKYNGKVVAFITRFNDIENKWVVSNKELTIEEIKERTYFLEQYFESKIEMIK